MPGDGEPRTADVPRFSAEKSVSLAGHSRVVARARNARDAGGFPAGDEGRRGKALVDAPDDAASRDLAAARPSWPSIDNWRASSRAEARSASAHGRRSRLARRT